MSTEAAVYSVALMEISELFNLPAHPLLVHLPVVLLPLASIGAVLVVIRPAWLARFGWLLLAITGIGALGAIFAAGSGEALEERVDESDTLEKHTELGYTARLVAILFFVAVAALVLFAWWRRRQGEEAATAKVKNPKVIATVLSALVVLGAVGATLTIVQAGHKGAAATWEDLEEEGGGGEEGAPQP